MLVKQFMSDQHLVQSLVCMPHDQAAKVPLSGPSVKAPRNTMAPKLILEYKKTAAAVEKAPWSMHNAARYLRDWCGRSELQLEAGEPPSFIFEPMKDAVSGAAQHKELLAFAPSPPKPVVILERLQGGHKKRKRTDQAEAAAAAEPESAEAAVEPRAEAAADTAVIPGPGAGDAVCTEPEAKAKAKAKATPKAAAAKAKSKSAPKAKSAAKAKCKAKAASKAKAKALPTAPGPALVLPVLCA